MSPWRRACGARSVPTSSLLAAAGFHHCCRRRQARDALFQLGLIYAMAGPAMTGTGHDMPATTRNEHPEKSAKPAAHLILSLDGEVARLTAD